MKLKQYNEIINKINWGKNTDYEALGKMLSSKYSKEVLREFQAKYNKNLTKVVKTLEKYAKAKSGSKYGYFTTSDDGWSDLTAHIAGLNQDRFEKILAHPNLALKLAENYEYVENFQYIFQYVFPEDYQ